MEVERLKNPQRKKKKKKQSVNTRTNILLFVVFLLFTALILRLGFLQIAHGESFKKEVERTEDITINKPVPRGLIYDKNHKLIVDNQPVNAITYTRSKTAKTKEMVETAEKLSELIDISKDDLEDIKERDLKDFWIIMNPKVAGKKVTKKELSDKKDKELYKLQLERITEEELSSFTKAELKTLAIFRKFNSGTYLTPQIVKNKDVTDEEMARVTENLDELPGVDTSVDWNRAYPLDSTLRSILGRTTSSDEGLPKEKVEYYSSRGYSLNERVGVSNLELQYEDILHGQKAKSKNKLDKSGNILSIEELSDGQRGKDLVLTIDIDFQKKVETIIEEELRAKKAAYYAPYLDRAFVVAMNPNTGEILALAGKQYVWDDEKNKYEMKDFAQGTYTTAYAMGSAVKAATVLTGYQEGVLNPGTTLYDAPMIIKETPIKKSYTNMGYVSDLTALQRSSNVYMFKTAIAIGEGNYVPNGPLSVKPEAFDMMRNHFYEFGLGKRTGIDLPGEQIGYKGTELGAGKLMDLAIGQYDTYTPLQLAQYISTIANGGYRVQPRVVKELREPVLEKGQLGPIFQEIEPKFQNQLSMNEDWINRVQEGLRLVTQTSSGTGSREMLKEPYRPAGKTGTAEAFYDGPKWTPGTEQPETWNITFAAYAPHDNPEIAISVVVPWAYQSNGHRMNMDIGKKVFRAYFGTEKEKEAN
ncbi:penicillin-binding protein [Bacillus sp. FJAT-27986]|nr:penicillin-binding protein [Bacillus sp. FJAT-27986]